MLRCPSMERPSLSRLSAGLPTVSAGAIFMGVGDGELVFAHVCKLGLEGTVSKRADAAYRSGRSTDRIKTKCQAWKEANRDRFEKM
jgi:ATP-dependent DNA ligase